LKANEDRETAEARKAEAALAGKRNELRQFSKNLSGGDQAVMEVAQQIKSA
jgi:hypothetical protein